MDPFFDGSICGRVKYLVYGILRPPKMALQLYSQPSNYQQSVEALQRLGHGGRGWRQGGRGHCLCATIHKNKLLTVGAWALIDQTSASNGALTKSSTSAPTTPSPHTITIGIQFHVSSVTSLYISCCTSQDVTRWNRIQGIPQPVKIFQLLSHKEINIIIQQNNSIQNRWDTEKNIFLGG